ncbi:MAG: hypothetical protein QF752_11205 [Planctomycetota bacterium]|nr:hypothetical protein [Planctomycetota bacterium]
MMWVLLTKTPWKHLSDQSSSLSGRKDRLLGFLLVGLGVALVLIWLVVRRMGPTFDRLRSRKQLLRKLQNTHDLNHTDRRLMMLLARRHRLEHSSLLFVKKSLFDQAIHDSGPHSESYSDLRDRLFFQPREGDEH